MIVILDLWLSEPFLVGTTLMVLISLNFYLLKQSYSLQKLGYAHHYKQSFYIGNPSQREIIEANSPITIKVLITWTIQIALVFIFSMVSTSSWPAFTLPIHLISETIVGFFIGNYIRSITHLLRNISLFLFIIDNPQSLQGEVVLSNQFVYSGMKHRVILDSFFWFLIFICIERVFLLGVCLNSILSVVLTFKWERETIKGTISV